MRRLALLTALALGALALAASAASAATVWNLEIHHNQTNFAPGGKAQYWLHVNNVGSTDSSGAITLTVHLPGGVRRDKVYPRGTVFEPGSDIEWSCPGSVGDSTVVCTTSESIPRHTYDGQLVLQVLVNGSLSGEASATAEVQGGGAAQPASAEEAANVSAEPAPFGIVPGSFLADFFKPDGLSTERRAGGRPDNLVVAFDFNSKPNPNGPGSAERTISSGNIRDLEVDLPPGFIGNPTAVGECSQAEFTVHACPASSVVGRFDGDIYYPMTSGTNYAVSSTVFNMTHPRGVVSDLAFVLLGNPVHVRVSLDPANRYAVVSRSENINESLPPFDSKVTIWGVPADESHDSERCPGGIGNAIDTSQECSTNLAKRPFLTLPVQCEANSAMRLGNYDSWQHPGAFGPAVDYNLPGRFSGCGEVPFAPSVSVAPTSDAADSPSGLKVAIDLPQHEGCTQIEPAPPAGETQYECEAATSPLKDATVALPEGITVNPASANGLAACTPAEISLGTNDPVRCPNGSKIATAKVTTPVLPDPVEGIVYLASPYENPFDSLLAGYIVLEEPSRGVLVKIPGKITADPATGQLTGTFEENPQLPFSKFELAFKAGAHSTLITPQTCGTYTATSKLSPWSGTAAVQGSSDFTISKSATGGACPASESDQPNSPSFDAGPVSPVSANYSPFVLHLRRTDGSQRFKAFDVTLPPGLTGKLAGTAMCSDAALAAAESKSGEEEQSSPSCPPDSHVGEVLAGVGAGSPYYARGEAYLAAPYKGAPVSLAVITPAVAGPFDLGTIVIRTPLRIDPRTAQISAVSDPIPTSLKGIPTDVRSVDVVMDRPQFTLTGTSCDPYSIDGSLTSTLGQTASLSDRYQLSDCRRLAFKPKLSLRLKGGTRRTAHPQLIGTVFSGPGQAGTRRLQVKLPRSAFIDQAHIRTVCTRVQFAAGPGGGADCPRGSVYGHAWVKTPLLDYTLSGPVFLRSSNHKLPDLVMALSGPASQPIHVELSGKTDSVKGALRDTFEALPDAPFTMARLVLFGGKRGLVVNSRSLCARKERANVRAVGHNGRAAQLRPLVRTSCKKRHKKHKKHRRHHHRRSRAVR